MLVRNDGGDPFMGNPNGSLTVYEFSDYNCGYCKRMFAPIMQMLAANGDVRLVVKEFPILSQSSVTAAKVGIAAQKQGKFKSFHTEMMTYRGQVNDASIMQAASTSPSTSARAASLSPPTWSPCLPTSTSKRRTSKSFSGQSPNWSR